jgi:hypothetical protein
MIKIPFDDAKFKQSEFLSRHSKRYQKWAVTHLRTKLPQDPPAARLALNTQNQEPPRSG